MIASYAGKAFRVSGGVGGGKVYTFDDFKYDSSLNKETQEYEGGKPSTWVKGANLRNLSISIPMYASLGVNIGNEIAFWANLAESGIPYPFIIGGRMLGNYPYIVTKATVSDGKTDNMGVFEKAKINLSLEEFVRPGSKPEESSKTTQSSTSTKKQQEKNVTSKASSKASSGGSSSGSSSVSSNWASDLVNKTEYKRHNPNAEAAVSAGTSGVN